MSGVTSQSWQRVKQLFEAALERDPAERAAVLAEACAGDTALRSQVEILISSDEEAAAFLEAPAVELGAPSEEEVESRVGLRIGPYSIVSEVGRGGMGAVYLAERADGQYQKKVAIKLVKRGMDTDSILRRFRKERQILAGLDHPNIAKLLDGGTTEEGLPYFVMEYVEGEPLHAFCDAHTLPIEERLKLFRTVCSAVHYAHRKQVIHRDLKPRNILVTEDGAPKLLDFGVARLLIPEPSAETAELSATGWHLLTPEYASPEQIRGEPVTAASDVYSLGVVLYELLTGRRPYRFKSRAPQEIARAVCEQEPERPSTAVTHDREPPAPDGEDQGLAAESVSRARETTPAKLRRRLAGDLENIVLKAMRKEPQRRYASAEELSEDIERHLEGRPVLARKSSLTHRAGKFLGRHKTAALASALAVLVLLVFSLGGRTKPAPTGVAVKSLAVLPFKPLGGPARDESLEFGMADALITQLSHVRQLTIRPTESVQKYAGSGQDPRVAARELRVDALLVGSVQRAGDGIRLSVQLIGARDWEVLWAETFDEQWTHIFAVQDAIATQVARALALRLTGAEREQLAKRDTDNTAAYREYLMGRHFRSQQTAEGLKRALQHYERAVELDPRYALAHAGVADSYLGFVTYRVLSGKEAYVKARASAAKARELNPSLSEAHMALAAVSLYHDWDWVAGERAFRRAIQLKPDNAEARMRYALALAWFERFDEALHEIGQARELDPLLRRVNLNTGMILYFARRYDEAIAESRRALALDPNFFQHHQMLGQAYVQARAYKDAIAAFKKALELGGGSWVEADLAHAYAVSGQTREAQKILNDLEDRSKRMYISPFDIAVVYVGLGDRDQAFAWLEKAYDERTRLMLSLKVNPRLDPLRSDPRFGDLLRQVGLPQQTSGRASR